jgi:hypothetical protein
MSFAKPALALIVPLSCFLAACAGEAPSCGNPVRYLQVRWGSKADGGVDQAAPE